MSNSQFGNKPSWDFERHQTFDNSPLSFFFQMLGPNCWKANWLCRECTESFSFYAFVAVNHVPKLLLITVLPLFSYAL